MSKRNHVNSLSCQNAIYQIQYRLHPTPILLKLAVEGRSKAIFSSYSSLESIKYSRQSERLERLKFHMLESSVHRTDRTLAQDSLYRIITHNVRHDHRTAPSIL